MSASTTIHMMRGATEFHIQAPRCYCPTVYEIWQTVSAKSSPVPLIERQEIGPTLSDLFIVHPRKQTLLNFEYQLYLPTKAELKAQLDAVEMEEENGDEKKEDGK